MPVMPSGASMAERTTRAPSHALCFTSAEVILCGFIVTVGVAGSLVHEVLFGSHVQGRLFSTTIDAIQGSLFWSAVLISLSRLASRAYRLTKRWGTRRTS